jgi:hypothetical protein
MFTTNVSVGQLELVERKKWEANKFDYQVVVLYRIRF